MTAAAQAASSLTRIRRVAVRFWRQATCICHPLEQFFNRRGSRNRLRARGPRSQGHVCKKVGMHPESQGAFQYGGGLLTCSEGAGCSADVRTVIDAVGMRETVDGSGSGGDFIQENQLNCGSIVPTGDLHPSPPGAVLQQAREPKLATGETAATAGTRSPKFWMHPLHLRAVDQPAQEQIAVLRLAGVQVIHIVEGILAFAAGFPSCRQGKLHPDNQSGRSSSPPCSGHSCREPSNCAFQSAGHSRLSRETSADLQDCGPAHQPPDAHRQRQTNDRHGDERDITQRAGLSNSHRLGHVACELRPGVD